MIIIIIRRYAYDIGTYKVKFLRFADERLCRWRWRWLLDGGREAFYYYAPFPSTLRGRRYTSPPPPPRTSAILRVSGIGVRRTASENARESRPPAAGRRRSRNRRARVDINPTTVALLRLPAVAHWPIGRTSRPSSARPCPVSGACATFTCII